MNHLLGFIQRDYRGRKLDVNSVIYSGGKYSVHVFDKAVQLVPFYPAERPRYE